MENDCQFVSSRGLLKSCTYKSANPCSSCGSDTSYLTDMLLDLQLNTDNRTTTPTIYVCSDLLPYFVNTILPQCEKMQQTFILLSGDSDVCVPKEVLSPNQTNALITSPCCSKWFAQNTQIAHGKLFQLPIGLDYHTINSPSHGIFKEPVASPGEQEQSLLAIKTRTKPFWRRNTTKIYTSFSMLSDRFGQRRDYINQAASLMFLSMERKPRHRIWMETSLFAFVASPFGNGIDCHRTWEALVLGCIPVIKKNGNDSHFHDLFADLPVLLVNDYRELNPTLLRQTISDFQFRQFNYDKLKLDYWLNFIRATE